MKMKFGHLFLILSVFLYGCASTSHKSSLNDDETTKIDDQKLFSFPKLPEGFSWKVHKGVAIPKPDYWSEHEQYGIYAASVESVKENGSFETGVTIQVYSDVQNKYKAPANVIALSLIKQIREDKDNKLLLFNNQELNDIKSFAVRYRNDPLGGEPIIVHKYIMASDSASYVNVLTFESPENTWNKHWSKEGLMIFKNIVLVN